MILPSKHLSQDRALLTLGARVLALLHCPKTVSALWEELNRRESNLATTMPQRISYDWFLLSLDFLYTLGAIELSSGLVKRRKT